MLKLQGQPDKREADLWEKTHAVSVEFTLKQSDRLLRAARVNNCTPAELIQALVCSNLESWDPKEFPDHVADSIAKFLKKGRTPGVWPRRARR